MSETRFTPGPWRLCAHLRDHDKCPCGYRGGIWGADGGHIVCEMGSEPTPGQEGLEPPRYPREVEFANAHLIVTAPEMHDALAPFADIDGEGDEDFPDDTPVTVKFGRTTDFTLTLGDFRRARHVLSKARGERP